MKNPNPAILICHHNDSDGIVSAMVCKDQLQKQYPNANFDYLKFSYGMQENLEQLKQFDSLYLVDASFSADTMNALYEHYGEDFVWIDHHISAITRLSKENSFIEGLRSITDSACKLCFRYFVGRKESLPVIVDLIDKWDMHRVESEDFQSMVVPANLIFMSFCDDIPSLDNLELLTTEGAKQAITTIGSLLKTSNDKRIAKEASKVFISQTKHNIVAAVLNTQTFTSEAIECFIKKQEALEGISQKPEVACVFNIFKQEGKLMVRASLYRLDSSPDTLNCASIAETYGGGGHKSAAGFTTTLDTFQKDFL